MPWSDIRPKMAAGDQRVGGMRDLLFGARLDRDGGR